MAKVDSSRRLLMVPEVADRLRVSVKTVRRLIDAGELPAVRLGAVPSVSSRSLWEGRK